MGASRWRRASWRKHARYPQSLPIQKNRMKKLIATAVVVGATLVPAGAQASPIRECGNIHRFVPGSPAGIINLTTRNVKCGYARSFSVAFTGRVAYPKHHYRFRGFSCTTKSLAPEEDDIRCVSGARVIHWQ